MKKMFISLLILILLLSGCGVSNNSSSSQDNHSQDSGINDNQGGHTHQFSSNWLFDDYTHYKECSCGERKDISNHSWNQGVIIKEATETENGIKRYTCTICGKTKDVTIDKENNEDNLTEIERTQKLIVDVIDSFSGNRTKKARSNAIKRRKIKEGASKYEGLSGELHVYFYRDTINDAFFKESAEPLSRAFGLLESFIQEGNPLIDFDGIYYFEDSLTYGKSLFARITLFEEYENIIAIDYFKYHMILGLDDNNVGFVYSYNSENNWDGEYLENIHIDYATPTIQMNYIWSQNDWKDEYEALSSLFEEVDELYSPALKLMKELLIDEEGNEIKINQEYDESNPSHQLIPDSNDFSYLTKEYLAQYFFDLHCSLGYQNPKMIIEEKTLKQMQKDSFVYFVTVPEGVSKIDDLAIWLNSERLYDYAIINAILLPSTIEEISEHAFDNVYTLTHNNEEYFNKYIEYVFIDSLDKKETVENTLKKYFPDIKIYYQDEWHIKDGIVLPIVDDPFVCNHIYSNMLEFTEEYHYVKCIICGEEKQYPHSFKEYASPEAACLEDGILVHKCNYCDYSYETSIQALGHIEAAAVEENLVDSTCTESGSYDSVIYCSRCGIELGRETITIEASGHQYESSYTYDEDYHYQQCSICEDVKQNKHILELVGEAKPTIKQTGSMLYCCSLCEYEREVELPKISNANLVINEQEKIVTYGLYPQRKISNQYLLEELNRLTDKDLNQYGWYYFAGNYYVKENANPFYFESKFHDDTDVESGQAYWFICEPIRWKILKNQDNTYTLLSESLLDITYYSSKDSSWSIGDVIIHIGKYFYSDIRNWLNNDFYGKAFAQDSQYVSTTLVDNSASTTNADPNRGWSPDSEDKVFLLSYKDYTNYEYGFSGDINASISRIAYVTDYALARGAMQQNYAGTYWTRSPDKSAPAYVNVIKPNGSIDCDKANNNRSIRPAIVIIVN